MDHRHFRYLLEQYITDSLTPDSADQLAGMLDKPEYRQALEAELERSFLHERYHEHEMPERRERLNRLILDKINDPAGKSLFMKERNGIRKWLSYAAALIIMLGTGAYLFYHSRKPQEDLVKNVPYPSADIAPGMERATLTLADGSVIRLDQAAKGSLAQQGNTKIIKLNSGSLAYQALVSGASKEVLYNTISTPRGGQYQIFLPDGTGVWLNAASSLRFPATFSDTGRIVEVTGEAYFEVAPHKGQPFYVKTGSVSVHVLGTSFDVNAYENENDIKTTLLEGSVKVARGDAVRLLRPGQQAVAALTSNHQQLDVQHVNISQVMAWKDGLFNFKDADLPAVMRQLERWYDIKVEYQGNIPQFRFQGKLPRNLRLSQVLKILDETEVRFMMKGRTLTVMAPSAKD